ncbi:Protein crumbs [Eumeta japonica]|uniref:Protein crumbs n=1 Tax=Eumeta variegata TaxID=151549 RepID=A0A4C1YMG4_EUMVA|nr:Protein crumbs [Eumeta japonica]
MYYFLVGLPCAAPPNTDKRRQPLREEGRRGLTYIVTAGGKLVANATFNAELVNGGPLESASATLLVGNLFSGCIHEGPQLEFHATATSQEKNVVFGNCPLTTDECKDRQDVLRMPPKDFCFNEPCLRHGTCISRHDRYECHCAARYTGNNCQVDKGNPCLPEPCEHGGRCVEDARGDYTCFCPPQYHGVHCEFEVSLDPLCVAGPCRNNGSCSVPAGADTYICECPPGYTGRNCETDVDECAGADAACLNGGRCLDAVNNYTCDCSETGYKGARCEINVNECEEERTLCGHGICYDTYGGYVCACLPGYVGDHCQKLSACASSPCGVGGTCFDEGVSFRCSCARGWSGPLCAVPMPSPPALSPSVAPPLSSCVNHVCPEHSHCRDSQTIGMSTASPTMTSLKQAQCYCDPGYFGASGMFPNCSTLELACEVGVCLNGATCSLAADHFNCTCAPGFKGAYCELAAGKALSELKTAERCADAPCMHARSCADLSLGFHCECETGWSGVRCDTAALAPAPAPLSAAVDNCATWPCHNGGTCRLLPDGYSCQCRPGYGGTHCDIGLDCRANGCLPRQACVERGGDAWACELAADSACASSPCHNGTCLALDNGDFDCSCPPGYTGSLSLNYLLFKSGQVNLNMVGRALEDDHCASQPSGVASLGVTRGGFKVTP